MRDDRLLTDVLPQGQFRVLLAGDNLEGVRTEVVTLRGARLSKNRLIKVCRGGLTCAWRMFAGTTSLR